MDGHWLPRVEQKWDWGPQDWLDEVWDRTLAKNSDEWVSAYEDCSAVLSPNSKNSWTVEYRSLHGTKTRHRTNPPGQPEKVSFIPQKRHHNKHQREIDPWKAAVAVEVEQGKIRPRGRVREEFETAPPLKNYELQPVTYPKSCQIDSQSYQNSTSSRGEGWNIEEIGHHWAEGSTQTTCLWTLQNISHEKVPTGSLD